MADSRTITVLDHDSGVVRSGYRMTTFYKVVPSNSSIGFKVRVSILRDFYEAQSYAIAELVQPNMQTTQIVSYLPSNWHSGTPSRATKESVAQIIDEHLAPISLALAGRAATVLGA